MLWLAYYRYSDLNGGKYGRVNLLEPSTKTAVQEYKCHHNRAAGVSYIARSTTIRTNLPSQHYHHKMVEVPLLDDAVVIAIFGGHRLPCNS